MSYGNSGLPRFEVRWERLTEDERRFIAALGTSAKANATQLRVSDNTYAELMQPLGRLKSSTLTRVRARITELLQETKNL